MTNNPRTMKRKPRDLRDFEFYCPFNETGFPMKLKRLLQMEFVGALEESEVFAAKYVTGRGEPGSDTFVPPFALPDVDGEPPTLTRGACRVFSIVLRAQVGTEYEFEDLVAMSVSDEIAEEMMEAAEWCQPIDRAEGNSPRISGEGSTSTPSGGSTVSPS